MKGLKHGHSASLPARPGIGIRAGLRRGRQRPGAPDRSFKDSASDATKNLSGKSVYGRCQRHTAAFDATNSPPSRWKAPECEFAPAIAASIGVAVYYGKR